LSYKIFPNGGTGAVTWLPRKLLNLRRAKIDTWFDRVVNVRRFSFAGFKNKTIIKYLADNFAGISDTKLAALVYDVL
jgi:hypothetical protein